MTESTAVPATEAVEPTEDQRRQLAAQFEFLREEYFKAALPVFLPAAVLRMTEGGAIIPVGGQQSPKGVRVMYDPGLVDWALDSAFQVADRAILARAGQLPRQLDRADQQRAALKRAVDAADAEASPAAALLRGPGS